jgi:hypothetical protein
MVAEISLVVCGTSPNVISWASQTLGGVWSRACVTDKEHPLLILVDIMWCAAPWVERGLAVRTLCLGP